MDGGTTDDQWWQKLTSTFGSGDLKIGQHPSNINIYHFMTNKYWLILYNSTIETRIIIKHQSLAKYIYFIHLCIKSSINAIGNIKSICRQSNTIPPMLEHMVAYLYIYISSTTNLSTVVMEKIHRSGNDMEPPMFSVEINWYPV